MNHLASTSPTHDSGDQPQNGQTRIEIFTDGSCIGNPGAGGYGIVVLRRNAAGEVIKSREASDFAREMTTNIRMELTGACVALESLGAITDEPIIVYSDANLISNAMTKWLDGWKARGWRKGDGKPVENRDLWERLERAAKGRRVQFKWVRGHNGSIHNERADKLAYAAARKAEPIVLFGAEG
ncbi:ribonuclease H family protein [Paracoccus aerodenitrificans]|uniref:ribonuclease H family protein n=1 Tax=Paracoccus aerodenitrificans TaxID=3017781 RepID=UPI0022F00902|nr:ribonuclease H [Paracoccus aerodenitrificans]WBU63118.1 ribonuclease HI [Paracoccus aerodenitrificans]